jgi:hypothetical protein
MIPVLMILPGCIRRSGRSLQKIDGAAKPINEKSRSLSREAK